MYRTSDNRGEMVLILNQILIPLLADSIASERELPLEKLKRESYHKGKLGFDDQSMLLGLDSHQLVLQSGENEANPETKASLLLYH